jgi:hypothetical protein
MQAYSLKYPKLSSAIHTFLATFLVTIVGAVAVIPADSLLSSQTWTTAFVVGILTAAVRAAIKAVSPLA